MKKIQLTQGKVALVDDEDFEKLSVFKWYAHWNGGKWYAVRSSNGKQKRFYMHREILNITIGIQGDHRSGDGLDNRRENLRFCTNQQNAFNQKNPHKDNKLGIKGVRRCEDRKKFQARIKIDGKQIHLGCFNVMGDADSAYRIAEEKYFGEFARKVK